jgi:hypothetical protein
MTDDVEEGKKASAIIATWQLPIPQTGDFMRHLKLLTI